MYMTVTFPQVSKQAPQALKVIRCSWKVKRLWTLAKVLKVNGKNKIIYPRIEFPFTIPSFVITIVITTAIIIACLQ
jgi:hypothetical protein